MGQQPPGVLRRGVRGEVQGLGTEAPELLCVQVRRRVARSREGAAESPPVPTCPTQAFSFFARAPRALRRPPCPQAR